MFKLTNLVNFFYKKGQAFERDGTLLSWIFIFSMRVLDTDKAFSILKIWIISTQYSGNRIVDLGYEYCIVYNKR